MGHSTNKLGAVLLVVWAALSACGDRSSRVEDGVRLLDPPLGLDSTLVMIDDRNDRALLLELGGDSLPAEPIEVTLAHDPDNAVRRKAHDEALVLSRGRRGGPGEDPEPAELTAIEPDGNTRDYVLGNPFDALAQSDDGRYALLWKTGEANRLLENPNEIAIVDLDKESGARGAVTLRTLLSFGDSPRAVSFSPRMSILGEDRRLAIVLSQRNVTLIDLNHLDRQETTVQLSQPTAPSVEPMQVVFGEQTEDDDSAVLYVRGSQSDDLYVFNLNQRPGGSENESGAPHNDFRPSMNQLGVGTRPSDMAHYTGTDGARLLALANDGLSAVVVEAGTSRVTSIALTTRATRLLLFEGTSPRDDEPALRALLYDPSSPVLTFLDLDDVEERGSRNVDTLSLPAHIGRLVPMLEEGLVLAIHDESVSLVDLSERTVSPISTSVPLEDALFDQQRRRLWVGPSEQHWVGLLDLETGQPGELLLDARIAHVVPMFSIGKLVATHRDASGYLTVIDVEDPDREHAQSLRGFLLHGLLDRGEP